MKISDIKFFLNDIEGVLTGLGFSLTEKDGNYVASLGQDSILCIPYIKDLDLDIPDSRLKHIIITQEHIKLNQYNCRVINIADLKVLLKNKCTLGKLYDNIVSFVFFDDCFTNFIDDIVKTINSNEVQTKEDNISNNLTVVENKIDIAPIEHFLNVKLDKKKKYYANNDYGVVAVISKLYPNGIYWYGYHDYQIKILKTFKQSYMAYFFKDRKEILLLPLTIMEKYRNNLNSSTTERETHWHIYLKFTNEKCLWQIPYNGFLDVTEYLINRTEDSSQNEIDVSKPNGGEFIIKIKSKSYHESKTRK